LDQDSYILRFWEIQRPKAFVKPFLKGLLPKQRKQQCQDDTDENGGNNGKVKSEVLLSNDDISGESPDPGNFLPDQQKNPDEDNKNTEQDEHFTQRT
jgi:hypothetical protein